MFNPFDDERNQAEGSLKDKIAKRQELVRDFLEEKCKQDLGVVIPDLDVAEDTMIRCLNEQAEIEMDPGGKGFEIYGKNIPELEELFDEILVCSEDDTILPVEQFVVFEAKDLGDNAENVEVPKRLLFFTEDFPEMARLDPPVSLSLKENLPLAREMLKSPAVDQILCVEGDKQLCRYRDPEDVLSVLKVVSALKEFELNRSCEAEERERHCGPER